MDAAALFRVISLIPDRLPRIQSGSAFDGGASERAALLSRFLGWLGPLNPIGKEEQQLLGVRAGAAKPLLDGEAGGEGAEEGLDPVELHDEVDESAVRLPGAGTQIAA